MKYKRILLKLSGESLAGTKGTGIDFDKVLEVCKEITEISSKGVEVAIVEVVETSGEEEVISKWIDVLLIT